jgi:hypothetical protein
MPNLKSMIAELEEMPEWKRQIIYDWHDKMKERGFKRLKELPSGEQLKEMVQDKLSRNENDSHTATSVRSGETNSTKSKV